MATHQVNKKKKTISKWVGEAGHNFTTNPNSVRHPTNRRELKTQSFFLRSKGFEPHMGHPTERWASQISIFDSHQDSLPSLLWRKPLCLSWNFSLRSKLQVWHTFSGPWSCSQGTQAVDALRPAPSAFLSSPLSPRKELVHLWGAPVVTVAQGTLLD